MKFTHLHESILDSMSEAVYTIDREMEILYANPAAEKITGYSSGESIGKKCEDIFCQRSDLCKEKCPPRKAMTGHEPILHKEAETRTKRGELRQTQISISPFFEKDECIGAVIVLNDVTELREAEERIRQQNIFLSTVINALPHPLYVIDAGSHLVKLANMSAYRGRLPGGLTCHELSHHSPAPCLGDEHPCPIEKVKETLEPAVVEHIHCGADGKSRNVEVHCSPILDEKGNLIQLIEYTIDISERRLAEQQLEYLAYFDTLTEIPNRRLFFDRLDRAVSLSKRDCTVFALLFLDLDRFKSVNDSFGHGTGDLLLKEVAGRLKNFIRDSDTVARMGGDEFAIILTRISDAHDAETVAGKISESLNRPFYLAGQKCVVGASIGISIYPFDAVDSGTLLKKADTAMYRAKGSRDAICRFSPEVATQRGEN
jgi:diguanylate cyclase (GGDEF)-like protein/PAS domain S-box-containing protein